MDCSAPICDFIARLEALAADSTISLDELVALVYGLSNPIMDLDFVPGRAFVTAKVLANPAYSIMSDIVFRKQLGYGTRSYQRNLQAVADSHSLRVSQVAGRLGISRSAVAQALDARRLSAWLKDGQWYIDPRSLAAFRLSPRGPASQKPKANAVVRLKKTLTKSKA